MAEAGLGPTSPVSPKLCQSSIPPYPASSRAFRSQPNFASLSLPISTQTSNPIVPLLQAKWGSDVLDDPLRWLGRGKCLRFPNPRVLPALDFLLHCPPRPRGCDCLITSINGTQIPALGPRQEQAEGRPASGAPGAARWAAAAWSRRHTAPGTLRSLRAVSTDPARERATPLTSPGLSETRPRSRRCANARQLPEPPALGTVPSPVRMEAARPISLEDASLLLTPRT